MVQPRPVAGDSYPYCPRGVIYPFFSAAGGEDEERILPGTAKRKLEAALVSATDKALNEIRRTVGEDKSDEDK